MIKLHTDGIVRAVIIDAYIRVPLAEHLFGLL